MLRERAVRSLWRIYLLMGERVASWPLWRMKMGNSDFGTRLDALFRRTLPSPSQEMTVHLFNGLKMVLPPHYQGFVHYEKGVYSHPTEVGTTRLFLECLRPGMCVVDVGAHLGYYTLLASKLVGSSGRVYAFEPDPMHFPYLVRNIEDNGCDNVRAEQLAVSDSTGQSPFFSQSAEGGSSLFRRPVGSRTTLVQTTTLDDYFDRTGWRTVDLVKMDIEGGETAALEGMVRLSQMNPQIKIVMEFEPRAMRAAMVSPEDLFSVLRRLGFRKYHAIGETLEPIEVEGDGDMCTLVSKAARQRWANVVCDKAASGDAS